MLFSYSASEPQVCELKLTVIDSQLAMVVCFRNFRLQSCVLKQTTWFNCDTTLPEVV